jgi:internalin A
MEQLTEAWLSDNNIADLTPLAGWKSIEYLHLSNNPITDITPLAHLSTLVQVHLVGCPVTTFAPVEEGEAVEAWEEANG